MSLFCHHSVFLVLCLTSKNVVSSWLYSGSMDGSADGGAGHLWTDIPALWTCINPVFAVGQGFASVWLKAPVQDTRLVNLHVKKHCQLMLTVCGGRGRHAHLPTGLWKTHLYLAWKEVSCETVRLQTRGIAMLLETAGISEERVFVQVYFGNYWSNTRIKPHPVTVSISGVIEL